MNLSLDREAAVKPGPDSRFAYLPPVRSVRLVRPGIFGSGAVEALQLFRRQTNQVIMDIPSVIPRVADGTVSEASAIGFAKAASPAMRWAPGVVAVRLRRGVELSNGRIAGETDRVVHLLPVPTTGTVPDHLAAFCGQAIWPGQAEHVAVGTGMPCMPCIRAIPRPKDTGVPEAADTP
jgi:hypothetical protein